jgi:hypothetical protein
MGEDRADHAEGFRQPGPMCSGVTVRATSSEASNDLVVGPQHRGGDRAGWAGRPCPLAPLGREDRCRGSRMMSRGVVSCLTQTGPRSTP